MGTDLIGFIYITDVCPRFEIETEPADEYEVYCRYHEKLISTIPVYSSKDDYVVLLSHLQSFERERSEDDL